MKRSLQTTSSTARNSQAAQQPDTATHPTPRQAPSLTQRHDAPHAYSLSTLTQDCLYKLASFLGLRAWARLRSSSKTFEQSMRIAPLSLALNREFSASSIAGILATASREEPHTDDAMKGLVEELTAVGNRHLDIAIDLPVRDPRLVANALARASAWNSLLIRADKCNETELLPFLQALRTAPHARSAEARRELSVHFRFSPALSEEMTQLFASPGLSFDEIRVHASSALAFAPPHPEWMEQAVRILELPETLDGTSLSSEIDALSDALVDIDRLHELDLRSLDQQSYHAMVPGLNKALGSNTGLRSLTLHYPTDDGYDLVQPDWQAILKHPSLSRLRIGIQHNWNRTEPMPKTEKHFDHLCLELYSMETGDWQQAWIVGFLECLGSVDELEFFHFDSLHYRSEGDNGDYDYVEIYDLFDCLNVRKLKIQTEIIYDALFSFNLNELLETGLEDLEIQGGTHLYLDARGISGSLRQSTRLVSLKVNVPLLPHTQLIDGLQANSSLQEIELAAAFKAEVDSDQSEEDEEYQLDYQNAWFLHPDGDADTIQAVFTHPSIRKAIITVGSKKMYEFCVEHLVDLKPSLDIRFKLDATSDFEEEELSEQALNKLKALAFPMTGQ